MSNGLSEGSTLHSCLYEGWVEHRRRSPSPHAFRYSLFWTYLDLDELDVLFAGRWLWSATRPTLAWFRREDHHGPPEQPLTESVRDVIEGAGFPRPVGPIRLLTQLRYFGYVMNPVSFYYCFDESGRRLRNVVAEVNNTPWGERHLYALSEDDFRGPPAPTTRKSFHVSPFMPMEMTYGWSLSEPGANLSVRIACRRERERSFDVAMQLERRRWSDANLRSMLVRYPLMTARVTAAIYWQALLLWWKRTPYFPHPRTRAAVSA